jgi:hypothetical protein
VVFHPILLESFVMSPTVSQGSRLMWQQLIDAQKASKLSVSQFCKQHGCSASSFYQWRRKLSSPSPKPSTEISVPAALGMGAFQQLIPKRPSGRSLRSILSFPVALSHGYRQTSSKPSKSFSDSLSRQPIERSPITCYRSAPKSAYSSVATIPT